MTQALLSNLIDTSHQFNKTVDFLARKTESKANFQDLFSKETQKNERLNQEIGAKAQCVDNLPADSAFVKKLNSDGSNKSILPKGSQEKNEKVESEQDVLLNPSIGENNEQKSDVLEQQDVSEESDVYFSINNAILGIMPVGSDDLEGIENSENKENEENEEDIEFSNETIADDVSNTDLVDGSKISNNQQNQNNILNTEDLLLIKNDSVKRDELKIHTDIKNVKVDEKLENIQSDEQYQKDTAFSGQEESLTNAESVEITTQNAIAEDVDSPETKKLSELIDGDAFEELNVEEITSETSTNNENSSDLMKHQSAEEQGLKAMLHAEFEVVESITDTKPISSTVTNAQKSTLEANPSKILEQISKQLEGLQHNSKVNIVLNPESLGKVTIQLVNTKEGLSAQLTCATQEARNILMKGLEGLKDTLIAQGINVENVTVNHEASDSKYQSDWTEQEGSRGGNKQQQKEKHSKDSQREFEQAMFNIENNENGNV